MNGEPRMKEDGFTPALGRDWLTGGYDLAIRLLTRERAWRSTLLKQVAPMEGETIADIGCGTGTLAIMMKRQAPGARIIGLDPDPNVLEIAAAKAKRAGLDIEWQQGFARDARNFASRLDKAVSSLVFHQVPKASKSEGLAAMYAGLPGGGELHIADYARQRGLMRLLFRLTVQQLDGVVDTQPNADGELEAIMAGLSGRAVPSAYVCHTPTGTIRLFRMVKPASP
jgi:ubiquinone/menaquinone biosynthesis C-methylase UbiE